MNEEEESTGGQNESEAASWVEIITIEERCAVPKTCRQLPSGHQRVRVCAVAVLEPTNHWTVETNNHHTAYTTHRQSNPQ